MLQLTGAEVLSANCFYDCPSNPLYFRLIFSRFILFLESTQKILKMKNVTEEDNIGNWIMNDS